MTADVMRRRRIVAVVAAVAVVALIAGVLVARGSTGGGAAIASGAARLVPAEALVYVHVSTDRDRGEVRDAQELAERFPGWERMRDAVLEGLAVGDDQGGLDRWLGDEAALALVGTQTETAGSLVLLAVRDEEEARSFVARGTKPDEPASEHRGVHIDTFGRVQAALVGGYLVLGQGATVRKAIDLAQGRGEGLAANATFSRLQARLPDDRAADAYATPDGLRRLLVPAGGALAVAGVLLDRPDLQGTAVALDSAEPGARMRIESVVRGRRGQTFTPTLTDAVPKGALAYLGTKGLDETATRLAAAAGTAALGDLLGRVREGLGADGAATVQKDLLALLHEETALVILPGIPAPTLLVIARTPDEARTRAALDRLTASLPKHVDGAEVAREGDVTVVTMDSTQLRAAVFDGKLAISTSEAGIAAARDTDGGIGDAEGFDAVIPDPERAVTSVVFLDFSQLLRLGEQTGLNDSRAYLAVKGDLSRVHAVGASSTGSGEDTTTEILFQIR